MKKLLSLVLALILLSMTCITVSAAPKPTISIDVKKYNSSSNIYESTETASSGDLLMVTVSTGGTIKNLAAINLRLMYNSSLVKYVESSATSYLVPGNVNAGKPSYINSINSSSPTESFIQAYVGAHSQANQVIAAQVTGDMFTFLFTCVGVSGTADFKVVIDEIYDTTYHTIKLKNTEAIDSVTLESWVLSTEYKGIFSELLDINYNPGQADDSKEDIILADCVYYGGKYVDPVTNKTTLYPGFTAAEMLKFQASYPELFKAYSGAWDEYYKQAENAILDKVLTERNLFLDKYDDVLDLSADKVTEANYESVLAMYKAYDKELSDQAKVQMDPEDIKHIKELNDAAKKVKAVVDARTNADLDAKDFHESPIYKVLWGLEDFEIIENYSSMFDTATSALAELNNLDFDNMSDKWKAIILGHRDEIDHILKVIEETVKNNAEEAAILAEVSAFNEQWFRVFKLNAMTVSINDKTAIEMMIEAYNNLSDGAKKSVTAKVSNAKSLLSLIESMNQIKDNDTTGTVVVPQSQIVEKIVYKDAEGEGNQTSSQALVREMPLFVKIMAIIAMACMLLMFVPVIIYCCTSKRFKEFIGKEADL